MREQKSPELSTGGFEKQEMCLRAMTLLYPFLVACLFGGLCSSQSFQNSKKTDIKHIITETMSGIKKSAGAKGPLTEISN